MKKSLSVLFTLFLMVTMISCLSDSQGALGSTEEPAVNYNPPPMDTSAYVKPAYNMLATDIYDLRAKLSNADSGDVIALANGVYSDVSFNIARDGVIVVAETSGAVFIEGVSTIEITGSHVVFEGFTFRNGHPKSGSGAIYVKGSHNRVTNGLIDSYNDSDINSSYKWVSLGNKTTYNSVDHCTFIGKNSEGALLVVWRDDDSANYHHIYRNIFMDYQYNQADDSGSNGPDRNGFESIRIGTSSESQSSSYTVVEYNYFYDCNGEIEIISNKSGHNVYRYNTFDSCAGMLTLRHGNTCTVDSNYFYIDDNYGGGIRVIDKDHLITNNYIEGINTTSNSRGGICITSHESNPKLSGYWEARNLTISNNTIINSKQSFVFGSSAKENPPYSATLSNNLIRNDLDGKGDHDVVRVIVNSSGTVMNLQNPTYNMNYYFGGSLGLNPEPEGFTKGEVQIRLLESGQYVSNSGSVGAPELERLSFSSDVGAPFIKF